MKIIIANVIALFLCASSISFAEMDESRVDVYKDYIEYNGVKYSGVKEFLRETKDFPERGLVVFKDSCASNEDYDVVTSHIFSNGAKSVSVSGMGCVCEEN